MKQSGISNLTLNVSLQKTLNMHRYIVSLGSRLEAPCLRKEMLLDMTPGKHRRTVHFVFMFPHYTLVSYLSRQMYKIEALESSYGLIFDSILPVLTEGL